MSCICLRKLFIISSRTSSGNSCCCRQKKPQCSTCTKQLLRDDQLYHHLICQWNISQSIVNCCGYFFCSESRLIHSYSHFQVKGLSSGLCLSVNSVMFKLTTGFCRPFCLPGLWSHRVKQTSRVILLRLFFSSS